MENRLSPGTCCKMGVEFLNFTRGWKKYIINPKSNVEWQRRLSGDVLFARNQGKANRSNPK